MTTCITDPLNKKLMITIVAVAPFEKNVTVVEGFQRFVTANNKKNALQGWKKGGLKILKIP